MRWRGVGVGIGLWAVLGCSGVVEGMAESIENDPAAKEAALKSFRESMVRECSKPIVEQGLPVDAAQRVCGCASDKMTASKDLKSLMKMAMSLEDPAVQAEIEGLMLACMAENGLSAPAQ